MSEESKSKFPKFPTFEEFKALLDEVADEVKESTKNICPIIEVFVADNGYIIKYDGKVNIASDRYKIGDIVDEIGAGIREAKASKEN